jgi:hypothetical protein
MKNATVTLLFLLIAIGCAQAQKSRVSGNAAVTFENQLKCKSNPKAGKILTTLRRQRFISKTYMVMDSVSYFRLHKPFRILGFNSLAVFGFQQGYRMFERGPGTAPPEMIGIVVRESPKTVSMRLQKLGVRNLHVEEAELDLNGNLNKSKRKLTEISCWEHYPE